MEEEQYSDFLTPDGVQIFNKIMDHLKENDLHNSIDFLEVCVVANAFALYRQAARVVNENGYATPPAKSGYQSINPHFTVMKETFAQINKHAPKFLMDASSRQKLFGGKLNKKEKVDPCYDLD